MKDSAIKKSIGCIGCGNMGAAILNGLSKYSSEYILNGFDKHKDKLDLFDAKKINSAPDIEHLVINSEIIILAIKPPFIIPLIQQIKPLLNADKIIISIAAGISQEQLSNALDFKCAAVKIMSNKTACVNSGVFAICLEDKLLSTEQKCFILKIFNKLGITIEMPDKSIMAFTALIGAGPGYVFHFMEALVQAGTTLGFSHKESLDMVTALCAGSVKLLESSDTSLAELVDEMSFSGSMTGAGIAYLKENDLQGKIVKAVLLAQEQGFKLEKDANEK